MKKKCFGIIGIVLIALNPELVDTDPPYIYNRSHLIAYAMAAEDLNEKNLITGTRHMNAETMLPSMMQS